MRKRGLEGLSKKEKKLMDTQPCGDGEGSSGGGYRDEMVMET